MLSPTVYEAVGRGFDPVSVARTKLARIWHCTRLSPRRRAARKPPSGCHPFRQLLLMIVPLTPKMIAAGEATIDLYTKVHTVIDENRSPDLAE